MDDYTPTADKVRERFIDGFPIDTWAVARDSEGKKFDRWHRADLARAWDEGFFSGYSEATRGPLEDFSLNPYREGSQ